MIQFHFLICSERSGSNFITSLMNGHSRVCGPPPSHLFRLFGSNRGNYGDLAIDGNWNTLIEDVVLAFDAKLGSWETTIEAEELRELARTRSAAELLRLLYEKEARADGADHVFVKENHTHSFVPFLMTHFPDCKFVFLARDPRDVASSYVKTAALPGGVEKAIRVWRGDQEASLAVYDQLRDAGRIALVTYEALVADAAGSLRVLTELLGLPYEDGMLKFHEQPRVARNARRIDAWANLAKPVMKDNAGKYRSVLTETDIQYIELACGDFMERFGYGRDIVTERPPDETVEARLDQLRPDLSEGEPYRLRKTAESEVREKRLAAIDRVLARKL